MKKPIYTITAITESDYRTRIFGYYHKKKDAIANVLNNTYDMHESYYMYIVIEEIHQGIHPIIIDPLSCETWFKYNLDKDCWEHVYEKPEEFKQCINFSIG